MADGTSTARPVASRRLAVWDIWVRLVHWMIVLLLPCSWWTAENDRWDWHFWSGYTLLTLLVFRIGWGLVGSDTARFARFLKSPIEGFRHLAAFRHGRAGRALESRRSAAAEIGHNAAGGWMVLVLLGLLLAQASSGLFADDLILTRGPLARWAGEAVSDTATTIHLRVFWVIVGATVLHIVAILAYRLLRGQNLVRPMITGVLRLPVTYNGPRPRMGHPLLAAALLAAAAGVVYGITRIPG